MGKVAKVESVDALKQFRASLCQFAEAAAKALEEADWDVRRTGQWVEQDQPRHWRHELHRRADEFNRAKLALERKRSYERSPLGTRNACIEEKKAFAAAKKRLEEAEQKTKNVRRWGPRLEQETFTYQSAVQGLLYAVEAVIPTACARIDRMVNALDAYVKLAPPSSAVVAEGEPEGPSMARPLSAVPGLEEKPPAEPAANETGGSTEKQEAS